MPLRCITALGLLAATLAWAEGEMPAQSGTHHRPPKEPRLRTVEGIIISTKDTVSSSEAVDEMLDELAADVARMGAANVSPILIERVRLSENMNPEFAAILESRLIAALQRAANVAVKRCVECWVTHGRVEGGEFVVTSGIVSAKELRRVAREQGAQTYLSVAMVMNTKPNALAMDVMLTRAEDGSVAYSEGFRVHPHTALLYRGADKAQAREAKLKDLEARIDGRPTFGHGALFGAMLVPTTHADGPAWGMFGAYRLYEKFGPEREWRLGITGGGFLNTSIVAGAVLTMSLSKRLTEENVFRPSFHFGGAAGAFLTGGAGNTPMFSLNAEYVMVHRLALQGSLAYMVPFDLGGRRNAGVSVGGLCPQFGMAFVW